MIGKIVEKDGKKKFCSLHKKDIFYYARFYGIPVYFQPEENEIRGRNLFWNVLLNILEPFIRIFPAEEGFPIEIENKTITRQEIDY